MKPSERESATSLHRAPRGDSRRWPQGGPLGPYRGRGGRQERTGPDGLFLERAGARFLRRPGYAGLGPRGYARSDDRILDDVCARLEEDGDLDASQIEVNVEDRVVRLSGFVDARDAREWAEELAAGVTGVEDVVNRLRVAR